MIDDFVFLCFFCGNDFLPHLPSFDIREGALDVLLELYARRQTEAARLGEGLITEGGVLVPARAASFLKALAEIEGPIFERRARRTKMHEVPKNKTLCKAWQRGQCRFGDSANVPTVERSAILYVSRCRRRKSRVGEDFVSGAFFGKAMEKCCKSR